MALVKEIARCPFCKEAVVKGAALCKHCQSLLPPPKVKNKFAKQINTFRTGFLMGEVQRTSEPKSYVGSSLYEYINGGSELYHKYEFTEVATAYYKKDSLELVIDVYEFADSVGSFGLYSMLRPIDTDHNNLGVEGFSSRSSVEFTKGIYIIKVMSFVESEDTQALMNDIAGELAKEIQGADEYPELYSCFMKENVIPYSKKIYSQSFLGYNFMTDVYKQDYVLKNDTFQVFLAFDKFDQKFNDWLNEVEMSSEDSVLICNFNFDHDSDKCIIIRDTYYGDILAGRKNDLLVGIVNFKSTQSEYLAKWLKFLENKKGQD